MKLRTFHNTTMQIRFCMGDMMSIIVSGSSQKQQKKVVENHFPKNRIKKFLVASNHKQFINSIDKMEFEGSQWGTVSTQLYFKAKW